MDLQQIWETILAWGLNHQLMQAMLAIQIHVDVEFPLGNVCPLFLYTREDEGRPYTIKMARSLKFIDKTLLYDT